MVKIISLDSSFKLTDEVKAALESVSKLAVARIAAILSQYLAFDERNVTISWAVQKPEASQSQNDHVMRIFACAKSADLYFEILADEENRGDVKISIIPPSDKKTVDFVRELMNKSSDIESTNTNQLQLSSGKTYKN